MDRPTLILDAEDTLWENNIFYGEATDAFVERMAREGFDPVEARDTFGRVEWGRVPLVGYAVQEFNQQDKVDRSGLAPYFEAVHVVPEKGPEVLRDLIARYGLEPRRTWMVGSSPRPDINPALAVGVGAVYIPYAVPWAYEEAPIADPDRVITLQCFPDLLDLFPEPEEAE